MSEEQATADRVLEVALERSGARDPREFYRERLRELKQNDGAAYDRAVSYYSGTLVPGVASGEIEPLQGWTEYGRTLAELTTPGRAVSIDVTGRSTAYESPVDLGALILHLPDARNERAIVIGIPPEPSASQRACFDWLVGGRQRLRD